MYLIIRMILYFIFAAVGGMGLGLNFNEATGDVSVNIDLIATAIVSFIGFVGTYWASRIAKRRGGRT